MHYYGLRTYNYNAITGVYVRLADPPRTIYQAACVQISDNVIFISGGYSDRKYRVKTTNYYDIQANKFTDGPDMPTSQATHCSVLLNSTHVFIGGRWSTSQEAKTFLYDTVSKEYTTMITPFSQGHSYGLCQGFVDPDREEERFIITLGKFNNIFGAVIFRVATGSYDSVFRQNKYTNFNDSDTDLIMGAGVENEFSRGDLVAANGERELFYLPRNSKIIYKLLHIRNDHLLWASYKAKHVDYGGWVRGLPIAHHAPVGRYHTIFSIVHVKLLFLFQICQ